jgi:hypothetical protein
MAFIDFAKVLFKVPDFFTLGGIKRVSNKIIHLHVVVSERLERGLHADC